ncbi:MAG: RNA 2',3'-cyclic phosphodiesterase [Promethearchaeia archaeon]
MIRTFIALELKDEETIKKINEFGKILKQNQANIKLVELHNLHLTVKFLGNIKEDLAPKIYKIIQKEINDPLFHDKSLKYQLIGAGHFKNYAVIWIGLKGDINFLQNVKDLIENKLNEQLKIPRDRRTQFKPHLTIGRLKSNKINYKNFNNFKKIITEYRDFEFGPFTMKGLKLKKSQLTPKGPIYTDLEY